MAEPDAKQEPNVDPSVTPEGDVTLKQDGPTKEDFTKLLTKISDLQEDFKSSKEPSDDGFDDTYNEPTQTDGKFDKDSYVGDMTLGQLTEALNSEVDKNVSQPLLEMITQIQVNEEIRDLETDKDADFSTFRKETFKIAAEQPRLSMRRCLELAKSENPQLAKKEETPNADKKGSNSNSPAPKNTSGEKPGVSQSAVDQSRVMTIEEATAAAIAEEGVG